MARQKRNKSWVQEYFFLFNPKPLKNELLSSWLTRVAIEHNRKLSTFISLFIKNDGSSIARNDIDFLYDEKFFNNLSLKSGFTKKQIYQMSLRSEEGYLYTCSDNSLYPPNQIRRLIDKRTHYGLMYCPLCLKEDEIPYFRKEWRYNFYNICTKHNIFLIDRCWSCYEKINFPKINHFKNLAICSKCGKDLRTTIPNKLQSNQLYGLRATKWLENGLNNGYFEIDGDRLNSVFVFNSMKKFIYLINLQNNLILDEFPLIEEYKLLKQKLERYNSKKSNRIYLDLIQTSMIYFLLQNYPKNLIRFSNDNDITFRDFSHGFKNESFWYRNMIYRNVIYQNKIGREISETEVLGAIKYLKSINKTVNQNNVAQIVGCHSTIHKGFVKIYKKLKI